MYMFNFPIEFIDIVENILIYSELQLFSEE